MIAHFQDFHPMFKYAFALENDQSPLADPIYTVLNSNFMQRWGKQRATEEVKKMPINNIALFSSLKALNFIHNFHLGRDIIWHCPINIITMSESKTLSKINTF
jgi:hypothetical protein